VPKTDANNLKFHYWLSGDAPEPVVLVHGLGGNLAGWHLTIVPDLQRDYRVLTYDLRGHGLSDTPATGYSADDMAGDLLELLDALEIERAHFCGFSDGGATLLYFALCWPERVRSLVLAGAQYTNDERTFGMLAKMSPERIQSRLPEWADRLEQIHDAHHGGGYWPELLRQMLPFWQIQPDLTLAQLGRIGAPALLIAGERDSFGHPEMQLAMRRALPRSELCILPRAAHYLMNEQPELFRIAVLDFLDRVR